MSMVILGSMHAVRFTHLTHHRLNLTKRTSEGRHAQMPGWRALLNGPYFTLLMHMTALRHGGRRLGVTVAAQLLVNAICIALIFRFGAGTRSVSRDCHGCRPLPDCVLRVWTVHHHCDRKATISPERCVIGS